MSSTFGILLRLCLILVVCKCAFGDDVCAFDENGKVLLPALPEPALRLYVSPSGSDGKTGSESSPFATLERARVEIRTIHQRDGLAKGGVTVLIGGGAYAVGKTLELTAEDSGAADAPIVYRAAEGATPVFSGGIRVTGFTPVTDEGILARLPEEARDKVSQVDLKPLGVTALGPLTLGGFASGNGFKTHPVNELFFNGEPLPMSRYPNEDVLRVKDVCVEDGHTIHGMKGSKIGQFVFDGDRPARWKDEKDAMLYGYWFFDWADSYERIAAIDTEKRIIDLAPPYHNYGYRKGARYYAVNLLSEIDAPGEWYLDRANGLLYLYPPSDPATATVELSLFAEPMLRMNGVSHVRFEGLTWELGAGDAIAVKDGERCLFAGCTVRRFGGDGITIDGGHGHGVLSCDIYSMGRGGTVITGGDRKTLTPSGHFVANCDIHHLSRIDHTYTPAVLVSGVGNRVAHNRMHHINSSAIRLGGNDHLVEFNEIHDALLESDDQGGADMFGDPTFRGNVYRYNYWHHLGNWQGLREDLSCGSAGIRLDDAISGTLIQGNVFYYASAGKLGFGGVQIHGGKDNIVENNVFAECAAAISCSAWDEPRWKAFVEKSLEAPAIDAALYLERYPELAHLTENANANTVRGNVVWKCGQFILRDSGKLALTDNAVTTDDACFPDASKGDFTFKATDAAPVPAGFTPIPFDQIGLYEDSFRRALPVQDIAESRARRK